MVCLTSNFVFIPASDNSSSAIISLSVLLRMFTLTTFSGRTLGKFSTLAIISKILVFDISTSLLVSNSVIFLGVITSNRLSSSPKSYVKT